jgi:hypothetical protein
MPPSSATPLSADDRELIGRLEAAETKGHLEDLEIEYWVGGGLPPPHHRSDQLRFLLVDGKPTIELNVATFDPKRPDLSSIEYRAPLAPDDLHAVATSIRETGVFLKTFPEEQKPDQLDILRTEVVVSTRDRSKHVKRIYYRAVPDALAPLAAHVRRISDRLRAEGKKRLFDANGKELP